MTDVRQRPKAAGAPPVRPSVVLHGSLVAGAAALSGLAVLAAIVLIAWVADAGPGSGGDDAIRAAANAWLLAHGGGLTIPSGHLRGIPLGLTVLAAIVLHRAGASLARAVGVPDLRAAARTTAALAVPYALLAMLVARLSGTTAASASAPAAGFGAFLLAALAGGRGVLRAGNLVPVLRRRLPDWAPAVTRAALSGLGGLLASGLAVLLASTFWHAGRFAELMGSLRPGLVGGVILLLGTLLLVPNAALWSLAYAAGPGFTVGAGTGVSPFGATLGPVPAFPLLAALPGDGTPSPAVRAVLLLPVLAGVLAGWELSRRLPPGPGARRLLGGILGGRAVRAGTYGLLAGAGTAVAAAVLTTLAGGSLGPGYLAAVGPSAWQVVLALAVEVGVPAAVTAAILPGPGPRTPRPRKAKPARPEPAVEKPDGARKSRPARPEDGTDRPEAAGNGVDDEDPAADRTDDTVEDHAEQGGPAGTDGE